MDAELTRRVALYELLLMPDPPDLRRGHVVRFEGNPDRYNLLPMLAEALAREKVLEFRRRLSVMH